MNAVPNRSAILTTWAVAGALLLGSAVKVWAEAAELTFPVLKIGTRTYTNVTVTTKAKDYVFLLHSAGMANFKVKELTPEELVKLGYEPPKPKTNTIAKQIARQAIATVESPQVQQVEKEIEARIPPQLKAQFAQVQKLPPAVVMYGALGIAISFYLFYCFCLSLICKKAKEPGGVMVWLPVLQVFPCLKAAGMSGWWFLALFVPVLNIVAQVIWCLKITKARGKHPLVGVLLILPLVNLFAFLYLAFSSDGTADAPKQEAKITLMKLQSV